MPLIDQYVPVFHFSEKHAVHVNATKDVAWHTLMHTEVDHSLIVRVLLKIRGIHVYGKTISDLPEVGFVKLNEVPGQEVVYGIMSDSWHFSRCASSFSIPEFIAPHTSVQIKATINFSVEEVNNGSLIATETRVFCTNKAALRKFRIYWFFVKPFSGLIRKLVLHTVKKSLHQNS